jgi:hypothetical protein
MRQVLAELFETARIHQRHQVEEIYESGTILDICETSPTWSSR